MMNAQINHDSSPWETTTTQTSLTQTLMIFYIHKVFADLKKLEYSSTPIYAFLFTYSTTFCTQKKNISGILSLK